jgi:hypothetical protein
MGGVPSESGGTAVVPSGTGSLRTGEVGAGGATGSTGGCSSEEAGGTGDGAVWARRAGTGVSSRRPLRRRAALTG